MGILWLYKPERVRFSAQNKDETLDRHASRAKIQPKTPKKSVRNHESVLSKSTVRTCAGALRTLAARRPGPHDHLAAERLLHPLEAHRERPDLKLVAAAALRD